MRFLLVVLLLAALCVSSVSSRLVFERQSAPKGWVRQARAHASAPVKFNLALKQRNLAELENLFWAVSTPGSKQYQQFKSIEEVNSLIAPSAEDVNVVLQWLSNNGIDIDTQVKKYADALEVSTDVETAETLFDTDMFVYSSEDKKQTTIKQFGTYSLPDEVHDKVEMVTGIANFPIPHYDIHTSSVKGPLTPAVVPQTLWSMYNLPTQYPGSANSTTSQGVIEFQQQYYAPYDLQNFAKDTNIKIFPLTAAHTVGSNDPQPADAQDEATLDIQSIAGVNMEAANWFWLEDGNNWLYDFAVHFFNTQDVPQVASISYGWSESDQCSVDTAECANLGVSSEGYVQRTNVEFQKIGLRGVSILVASGDSGANGRSDGMCLAKQLRPSFPGASPYVTAVGATQVNSPQYSLKTQGPACNGQGFQCISNGQEVAVSYAQAGFASGGGFSDYSVRPAYQDAAVSAYLKSGVALPPATYFNSSNRGYPDIAALGSAILIDMSGLQVVGGTSASTPIFSGVISMLNQAVIAKSGKPLGFLNPFLYKMAAEAPQAFTDITVGDNKCTEQGCMNWCQGYLATKGWDPVTGLGSPNYENMLAYVKSKF